MDLIGIFPSIVAFGVSLQALENIHHCHPPQTRETKIQHPQSILTYSPTQHNVESANTDSSGTNHVLHREVPITAKSSFQRQTRPNHY